jgi:2,3-bisphosphoglycerate-independent phosphoglycerate mutase
MSKKNTITLLILDGFGHSTDIEHNAIAQAHTPNLDLLKSDYPHNLINASEDHVGLPKGQMGNSEVGHINIGAGRIVFQDIQKINNAIQNKELDKHTLLIEGFNQLKQTKGRLHFFGLLSDGGVHSHYDHFEALLFIAKKQGVSETFVHAFLDGRDTPPKSAEKYIGNLEQWFKKNQHGKLGSISGRFYAMDRDNRWDRIEKVYKMLIEGQANFSSPSSLEALNDAYVRNELDEFVSPTLIHQESVVQEGDMIVFLNFNEFNRDKALKNLNYLTMTCYDQSFKNVKVLFPPIQLKNTLGSYLAEKGFTQLRIAETEKYPHVTFFFNGGQEKEFPNEDRILIPSPDVNTYDLKPEMSVYEVSDKLCASINSAKYDVIICNFANGDMVGHSGNLNAAKIAVEAMDLCIGKIIESTQKINGSLIITADHGNAELMMDVKNNQAHTQHTTNLVPFIVMNSNAKKVVDGGKLSDIAPTILSLLNCEVPKEMTGKNLIQFKT